MPRHMVRPHVGKVPMKFYFRAQEIVVLLPGLEEVTGKLTLAWKRGPRRTTTEPFPVKERLNNVDGTLTRSASTPQDLALICTMFKNSKGSFEAKAAAFTIREEREDGSERKLGTSTIDLSSYATLETSSDRVELSFCEGKVRLQLTISSHWLKHMKGGTSDGDDGSVSSFASSSAAGGNRRDISEESDSLSSLPHMTVVRGTGGAGSGYVPMSADAKRAAAAAREGAIEARWADEENRAKDDEEKASLRDELAAALEQLGHAQDEAKYLREKADRMAQENRVLRRGQRGGKRDEVILQLETELQAKEDERADMEEELSQAFSEIVKELSAKVSSLTSERDRLLVEVEESTHRKGGFLTK